MAFQASSFLSKFQWIQCHEFAVNQTFMFCKLCTLLRLWDLVWCLNSVHTFLFLLSFTYQNLPVHIPISESMALCWSCQGGFSYSICHVTRWSHQILIVWILIYLLPESCLGSKCTQKFNHIWIHNNLREACLSSTSKNSKMLFCHRHQLIYSDDI